MTEQRRIFGTDGVRGVANVEPVTAETALKLGRAAAYVFAQLNPRRTPAGARPKIVLGKDTRLSGYMLENALVAGITSLGVDVLVIGPLPTPGDHIDIGCSPVAKTREALKAGRLIANCARLASRVSGELNLCRAGNFVHMLECGVSLIRGEYGAGL